METQTIPQMVLEAANSSGIEEQFVYPNHTNSSFKVVNRSLPVSLAYTLFIMTCLFLVVGVFGNISIFIIMTRPSNRSKPQNWLVITLTIIDTLILVTNTFNQIDLLPIFNEHIRGVSNIGCKIFWCVQRTATLSSTTITVLICIERFIVVVYPLKSRHVLTRRVFIVSVCVCGIFSLLVGLVLSVPYSGVKNGVCVRDTHTYRTNPHVALRQSWYSILTIAPVLILISLTPVTIYHLYRQQALRARLTSQEQNIGSFQISVMLISVVIAYLILVGIPNTFQLVWRWFVPGRRINIASLIALAVQINHSTNFVLYGMSNEKFRKQCLRLYGCSCRKSQLSIEAIPCSAVANAGSLQLQQIDTISSAVSE